MNPQTVLRELLELEAESNTEDIELCKPLWRTILGFYISSDCPEIITKFLNGEEIDLPQHGVSDSLTINVTDEDIEQCALISQGKEILMPARTIPMFVGGLVDALKGTRTTDNRWRTKLSEHSLPLARKLGELIDQFGARNDRKTMDGTSVIQALPVVSKEIDGTMDEVIFIGKVLALTASGAFFVTPISLLIDGNLRDLPEELVKDFFPMVVKPLVLRTISAKNLLGVKWQYGKPDINRLINPRSMSLLTTCRAFILSSRCLIPPMILMLSESGYSPATSRKTIRRSFFS
nr:hypothetical protein PJ912_00155 [Pectobacterium colocasium]